MSPSEAMEKGLEPGAARLVIRLDNGELEVNHGEGGALLLRMLKVKAGTWDRLWELLETCGEVDYRCNE
jgi:hypothetical protein